MSTASVNFDLLARDRASDKFQKVGKAAETSGSKVSKFGKLAKVGFAALGGGVVVAGAGFAKMAKAAAEDQQSQVRLAKTLKNTTGATKQQVAGVEDWISAQGRAYGVADDDLRPALGQLATATGSVGKSQKLASLAMNISAGTGKKLSAVSQALAKAYNGNVGGLSRLGIATKDASGKTKSFAQLQAELSQKFKGQASAAANTFQGRLGRLKLALSEAGESIGYTLLPLAQRFIGWVVNKGIPAISRFADWFGVKVTPKLQALGSFIQTNVVPSLKRLADGFTKAFGWISHNLPTVGTFVGVLGTFAVTARIVSEVTKVWAARQAILNAVMAMNPIGLVAVSVAGLAAGMVYAYKHSQKFRTIVTGAFSAVKSISSKVANFFTNQIPAAFGKVKTAASNTFGWVKGHWPLLVGILTGPIGLAVVGITRNWQRIKDGATSVKNWIRDKFGDIVGFARNLPDRISHAAGSAFNILKSGISSAKAWIRDRFGDIVGFARDLPGRITRAASGAFNGLVGAFRSAINSIIGKWNGLSFRLPSVDTHIPGVGKVGGFSIGTPDIPYLARGVRGFAGGLAVVGERGPELVRLPAGSDVYSNRQSAAMVRPRQPSSGRSSRTAADDRLLADMMRAAMTDALASADWEIKGDRLVLAIQRNFRQKGRSDPFKR